MSGCVGPKPGDHLADATMLTRLTVQQFRGIRSLTISDLSFVNIFVGANGAGKTTLLEAASVAANPLDPGWLMTLSQWREMPTGPQFADDWIRSFLYVQSGDANAELCWTDDESGGDGRLVITPVRGYSIVAPHSSSGSGSGPSSSQGGEQFGGVELQYTPPQRTPVISRLIATGNNYQIVAAPPGMRGMGAFYIHARRSTSLGETAAMLTVSAKQRTEESVYSALRRVDPRVSRLVPGIRGREPTVLVDVGLPQLVPANLLGDGFSRVLLMVTGAVSRNTGLLLVDDIDSGLHSSIMAGVWQSLVDLNGTRPFQVICTTHNEEMLQSTLDVFEGRPDLLRIFRIDRRADDCVTVQPYDFKLFRDVSAAGMDVR